MQVLITGGAGFLGQAVITRLIEQGLVIKLDGQNLPVESIVSFDQGVGQLQHPKLSYQTGDIGDAARVSQVVSAATSVVIHLAAVVSSTAEAQFDLGMHVNVDGTRNLLEACRHQTKQARLLFASSVATFGGALPTIVLDSTTPTPQGSYGIQKLIGEHLVQDYSRKGFIDGRSVRVPTVVVRPGTPNGAASGFASGIIREPLRGIDAVLPVPGTTQMWVAAPQTVVTMLLASLALPAANWGMNRSLNLPGLTVSMDQALESLGRIAGSAVAARVSRQINPAIERLVASWPARFDTARASQMGIVADTNFDDIVQSYIANNPTAIF